MTRAALTFTLSVALAGCVTAQRGAVRPRAPAEPPVVPVVDPWAGRTDLIAPPAPPIPPVLATPPVRRIQLPNGLRVVVEHAPAAPLARVLLVLGGGEAQAPAGRDALARAAARALLGGAGRRSGRDVQAAAEAVGGRLWAAARIDTIELGCEVLPGDLDLCVQLLGELARATSLPAEVVSEALRQAAEQPVTATALAAERARTRAFGESTATGGPSPAVEVATWARARLEPSRATLVVRGSDRGAATDRTVTTAFGPWSRGAATPQAPRAGGERAGSAEVIDAGLARPAIAIAALVSRGEHGFSTTRQALARLALAAEAAGARRVAIGVEEGSSVGLATLSFGLDRADAATLARVLAALSADAFGDADAVAVARVLAATDPVLAPGSWPSLARLATTPTTTPTTPTTTIPATPTPTPTPGAATPAPTPTPPTPSPSPTPAPPAPAPSALDPSPDELAELRAIAVRLIPARATVVVVGDGATLAPVLAQAGLAATTTAPALPLGVSTVATPAQRVAGRRLLEEALAVQGGATRIGALRALAQRGRVTLVARGQTVNGTFERTVAPARGLRIDFTLPIGAIGYLATPERAWVTSGGRVVALDGPEAQAQARALWRERTTILLRHRDAAVEAWTAGTVTEGGVDLAAVVLRAPDGTEVRLLLDPRSHRLFGMEADEGGVRIIERYSDYRPVAGIAIAHRVVAEQPEQRIDAVVTETRLDPELPEGTFEEPTP